MVRPLVSIVTPVYNGADYLEECVESVLSQTYEDWEHVIVDNASTDATPEIAERFAKHDSRIRHLRFEEFLPAVANHNRAVQAISPASEFCKVLLVDDWMYSHCLSLMIDVGLSRPSIGMVSAYCLWDTQLDHVVPIPYTQTYIPGHEMLHDWLLRRGDIINGAPSASLLRSDCVRRREPFYRSDYYHPDTEAAQWVLSRYDFGFVHQVLTYRRKQPGATIERTLRFGSLHPERIRMLLRYGPEVLTETEYRRKLRWRLGRYTWFHLRELPRLSRLQESEFFALHLDETAKILEESRGDPEVTTAISAIRALLRRGAGTRGVAGAFSWN